MDKNQQLSPHFRLSEFINRDDEWAEVPVYLQNLKQLALQLEIVRAGLGNKSIIIKDGLRTLARNKELGGAKFSYHLVGMAADIAVAGMAPKEVQQALRKLNYKIGLGCYDAHTHVDIGPKRTWYGKSK